MELEAVGITRCRREEQRNGGIDEGAHEVKIAFVVLLTLNWNTF